MLDLKITRIINLQKIGDVYWFSAVHFKVNEEHYYLHLNCECTETTSLYKGRMKSHLTLVSSCYGHLGNIIKFKKKPKCLKYIDAEHFVQQLKEHGLWKGELELL